jgi:hypothetical protein
MRPRARTRRSAAFAAFRAICTSGSPAKAGAQEREALQPLASTLDTLLRTVLGPGLRRGTAMKPINVWPMAIMLIVIVLLVIYLRPH